MILRPSRWRLAAVLALLATACSTVVVERGPEGDGGGGAGGAGGGSGSGGFTCDAVPGEGERIVYQCSPASMGPNGCPSRETQALYQELSLVMEWETCQSGCCYGEDVGGIPCGPDPTSDTCCYYVRMTSYGVCAED